MKILREKTYIKLSKKTEINQKVIHVLPKNKNRKPFRL